MLRLDDNIFQPQFKTIVTQRKFILPMQCSSVKILYKIVQAM